MKHLKYLALIMLCVTTIYVVHTFKGQVNFAGPVRDTPIERTADPEVDWHAVRQEVAGIVQNARAQAMEEGKKRLGTWHADVMRRLDTDFLEWYFGYWNTQKRSVGYMWNWMWDDETTADREMAKTIAAQLSARALPPHLVDKQLEIIAADTANAFVTFLRRDLGEVPRKYSIPPTRWDEYLDGITFTIADRDGSDQRLTDVSLKGIYSLGAIGGISAASAGAQIFKRVPMERAIWRRVASYGLRTAGRVTATTGVRAGSIAGGPLVAAVAIVGTGAWEWWDYSTMVEEERPRMRANIEDFLKQFEQDLLRADGAIGAPVHQIETAIFESVTKS